jgi:hypothetical protein
MPDPGKARPSEYLVTLPEQKPDYPPLPWKCESVTMLNVYFEVRKDALIDRLPSDFNRTSPAYCRLSVIDHPSSPAGAFREATLALGCRFSMLPGAFAAVSITDNAKVCDAGIFERGFPSVLGEVELEANTGGARAAISDHDGKILEIVMPSLQTIEPGRLAYDHVDSFRTEIKDGKPRAELVVTSPDMKITNAAICKNAQVNYADRRNDVWTDLRSRNIISAQVVRGTRTFAAAHLPGSH